MVAGRVSAVSPCGLYPVASRKLYFLSRVTACTAKPPANRAEMIAPAHASSGGGRAAIVQACG